MANFLDKLTNKLDKSKAFKFSEIDAFEDVKSWVTTGSPYLDYSLKTYGYPTGIIECRGPSQSGKTTLSLHACKSTIDQYKDKAVVVILSSERRDNREVAETIGLDLDRVLIVRTGTLEEAFNVVSRTVEAVTEDFGLDARIFFILDSLGNTVSSQEKDALKTRKEARLKGDDTKHAAMGSAARAISLGLRGLVSLLDENEFTFFMINRAYDKIGSVGKSSYGGTAVEFYPTMRLDLRRKEGLKVGDDEVGQITIVQPIKTDFDRPKQKFEIEIGYGYGIVLGALDIELGIKLGVLEKFGANGAKFNEKLKWKSRRELYQHYEDGNPMLKILLKKLTSKAHEQVLKERNERKEQRRNRNKK